MDLSSIMFLICVICMMLSPFSPPGILDACLSLGIASLFTGIGLKLGVIPADAPTAVTVLSVFTVLSALILWKPLRKLQKSGVQITERSDVSDFVGREITLTGIVSKNNSCPVQFSGLEWSVRLDPAYSSHTLNAGETVLISSVQVGVLFVRPLE